MSRSLWKCILAFVALAYLASPVAFALTADELLLIVNKNEPKGRELAEYYTQQRKVPAGRIVEVDLPVADEIDFQTFERNVVPPVRAFLRDQGLTRQIKCLVTFYGVPLRVSTHLLNDQEKEEVKTIEARLNEITALVTQTLTTAEALASEMSPDFRPGEGEPLRRIEVAINVAARGAAEKPVDERSVALGRVMDVVETIAGDNGTLQRLRTARVTPSTRPAGKLDPDELQAQLRDAEKQLGQAMDERYDPAKRQEARDIAKRLGVITESNILQWQHQLLESDKSQAAIDSELPFVLWPGYPRGNWAPNLLHYGRKQPPGLPFMMVSRIDAPTPELAKALIGTSIAIESKGLRGAVAIDVGFSKGKNPKNPEEAGYIKYDESLLDLAQLVQNKTKLSLVLNRAAGLMPPGSAKDVAIYCGWYSLRKYVPSASFSAGAVGYHIASWELVGLHSPQETGWVHGLMTDGVVASIGPVAEPYLHSFPLPSEFFPLLMTGKLTLAETYWKTELLASWMQSLVGDPLYTPYKVNPALKVEDLPGELRKALE